MLALRLTFPWGRYYAHPWGLNPVRLREAEWPPSPWRLLRALAAGWFRAHSGLPATEILTSVLEKLGQDLPEIAIGPVSFAQTVHWQPNFGAADKDDRASAIYKRTRHENHFAATEGPVVFHWKNVVLGDDETRLLSEIVPHVTYFGRAESLCRLELIGDVPIDGWCRPYLKDGQPARRIAEDSRDVFCPDPRDFEAADLWSRRDGRDRRNLNDAPPHLVEELISKQPLPDGARWITYQMPQGWPGRWVVRVARATRRKFTPSVAPRVAHYLRFSLQCRVPVQLKFTVPLAEQFRAAAISHFKKIAGDDVSSFALSGHDKPTEVQADHQHAFYLPLAIERDLLTEFHVWCPYGFTQIEVEALMRVHRLDWGGGRYPIRPILMSVSNSGSQNFPIPTGQLSSHVWRSRTPFVPPRYFYRGNLHGAKLKMADVPEQQLAQCLRQIGITTPGEIRRPNLTETTQRAVLPSAHWDIVRAPEGEDETTGSSVVTAVHLTRNPLTRERTRRIGFFFEVRFESPVAFSMPAVGHSCHFGLGQFVPV